MKPFWDKRRPYFSNKRAHGDSKIILIEKEEMTTNTNEIVEKETLLVNNDETPKTFNKHFAETVEKLSTFEWLSTNGDLTEETAIKIIKKFNNHPSVPKIKSKYLIQEKFSFQPVSVKDVENIIKNIPSNKTLGGDISIQILKQSGFTYQILTDCINDNKENYRPVSVLPLLSKVLRSLKDYFMINLVNTWRNI